MITIAPVLLRIITILLLWTFRVVADIMLIMILIIFTRTLRRFWVEVCWLVMGDTSASGGRFVVSPLNAVLQFTLESSGLNRYSAKVSLQCSTQKKKSTLVSGLIPHQYTGVVHCTLQRLLYAVPCRDWSDWADRLRHTPLCFLLPSSDPARLSQT